MTAIKRLDSKLPQVGTTIFSTMSQLANIHQAINLSQGFPDFPAPEYLISQLAHYAVAGHNQYAPMAGIPALQVEIAKLVAHVHGRQIDPSSEITVTSGATEALFVAIQAIVNQDDEVIVFDPAYDSYEPAVHLAGGHCRHIPLMPPGFSPNWNALEAAITPRTCCIIVNSPHNPTASCFAQSDWEQLAVIANKHDLWVISDEVYEHIVFDSKPRLSAHLYPAIADRAFVISSFGKTFHTTGWKMGYCVAPPALSNEFRKIHQYVTFSSFTPAQYALTDLLRDQRDHVTELAGFYQQKRDLFAELTQNCRLKMLPSAGTYFMLADYSEISDLADVEFCRWLTENCGVAAIPLSPFYENATDNRIIRFCFAKQDDTLRAAAERLCNI